MILLDTSVLMALAFDEPMARDGHAALRQAAAEDAVWVSAVSAWELGLIATRTGRSGSKIGDARAFFNALVARSGLKVLPLTAAAALEAAYLPEPFHRDPSDRMLVAAARLADLLLLTSDRKIMAYAALGHVRALRC